MLPATAEAAALELLRQGQALSRAEHVTGWVGLMRVLVRQLLTLDGDLPQPAQEALDVAAGVWLNQIRDTDPLLKSKGNCWHYLDTHEDLEPQSWEDRSTRAVLAVLEPAGDREKMELTAEAVSTLLDLEPR